MMQVLCSIQARVASRRLPGKVLREICGIALIRHIIHRLSLCKRIDSLVLATSTNRENDMLEEIAAEEGIGCFRGDEDDVMRRFYDVICRYRPDHIVRVCADSPLIDPVEVDRIIAHHLRTGADYSFNHIPAMDNNYPDGVGAEIFCSKVIKELHEHKQLAASEREHINEYIWNNRHEFHIETLPAPETIAAPELRLDVDTEHDLAFIKGIYAALYKGSVFPTEQVIGHIRKQKLSCGR